MRKKYFRTAGRQFHDAAILVGNGINNYLSDPDKNSWMGILEELGISYSGMDRQFIHDVLSDHSVTYPEFFDLIQLLSDTARNADDIRRLKAAIGKQFNAWQPKHHHRLFMETARSEDLPVLTTNFDFQLESASPEILEFCGTRSRSGTGIKPSRIPGTDRSRTYPWHSYFSTRNLSTAFEGFGIWHIHGMGVFPQSIRLSLSDYMASVERARSWLHEESGNPFISPGGSGSWRGKNSWLDLILHRNLFIFGLALESQEVGIRWLLIERERYYRKHERLRKRGWYAVVEEYDTFPPGKQLFFENLGFEILRFRTGKDLYEDYWLNSPRI